MPTQGLVMGSILRRMTLPTALVSAKIGFTNCSPTQENTNILSSNGFESGILSMSTSMSSLKQQGPFIVQQLLASSNIRVISRRGLLWGRTSLK